MKIAQTQIITAESIKNNIELLKKIDPHFDVNDVIEIYEDVLEDFQGTDEDLKEINEDYIKIVGRG